MNLDRLDWDQLRVFRIVAESGSLSAAARRLGDSTPTVSRKVDQLETVLNARLFSRTNRGIELTTAGEKALRHTTSMAEAAEALHSDVADADQPTEGIIRLVTGDGLGAHWIAPHLPLFHLAHPKVQLQMKISDRPPDLLSGEADIAIQFSEPRQSDLVARKLGTLHYMCFASRAYLDIYGEPKSIFDFPKHRCIFHDGYVNQIERWPGKTFDFSRLLDFALVTNSGAVMMAVCAGGGGVAVLPSYVAVLDDRLVPLSLPEVMPASFWISYTERVRRLPRGQAVIEWMRSLFDDRKHPWFRSTFYHPSTMQPEDMTAPPRAFIPEGAQAIEEA